MTHMSTLVEIETAVVSLPAEQQQALFLFLADRLGHTEVVRSLPRTSDSGRAPNVLDIPTVQLGQILRPLSSEDDLLGEMLECRA